MRIVSLEFVRGFFILFTSCIAIINFRSLDTINVLMRDSSTVFHVGILIKISELEANKIEKGNPSITVNNKPRVIVQLGYGVTIKHWKFIINEQEIQKVDLYFKCSQKELNAHTCEPIEDLLYEFLSLSREKISPFSYTDYWDRFEHYFENNDLFICNIEQSAKRWLEYFRNKKILEED